MSLLTQKTWNPVVKTEFTQTSQNLAVFGWINQTQCCTQSDADMDQSVWIYIWTLSQFGPLTHVMLTVYYYCTVECTSQSNTNNKIIKIERNNHNFSSVLIWTIKLLCSTLFAKNKRKVFNWFHFKRLKNVNFYAFVWVPPFLIINWY